MRDEEQLKRREHYLRSGEGISLTGSFTLDIRSGKVECSEQLRNIFEIDTATGLVLESFFQRVHHDDRFVLEEQVTHISTGGRSIEFEVRLLMPDGRIKFVHAFANVFRHDDETLECIGAVQDVTRRRLAEEALDRARGELAHMTRVMSIAGLTAAIAHEVNQPLSGIVTNATTCLRMLSSTPPDIDGACETARRSLRDGHRASEVIKRLRGLVQKKDNVIERIDLNDLCREVLALTAPEIQRRGISVQSDLDLALRPVFGDRVQLMQVVLNLVLNAADALATVSRGPRCIKISSQAAEADLANVLVSDTGQGVAAEDAERIFDAFYTTKEDGMGMGLSVSRSIVERHSGKLWIVEPGGPGATFALSLPAGDSGESY